MLFFTSPKTTRLLLPTALAAIWLASAGQAHEAWLLTPNEIETLAAAPVPPIFTSYFVLSAAALVGCAATAAALFIEDRFQAAETLLAPSLQEAAGRVGPAVMRATLATMLGLAGTGGLPRHGTAPWVEPTLLVPDMQLALVPGWEWLASAQIALALFLLIGLYTRIAAAALIGLTGVGLAIFGTPFIAYVPHFIAPGLILMLVGGGRWSLDDRLGLTSPDLFSAAQQAIWRLAQILIGAGFVYLAVAYKLTQPTLLIAILQHGDMPTFGLSYPILALIMTGVEIICGALLVAGRLVRPVSLVIIGAITFLAFVLGETPLFHANLYGAMTMFALVGRVWPATHDGTAQAWRVAA